MPAILQGVCNACGFESQEVADRWMAVRLRGGEEVTLPHPLEDLTLKELGLSWKEARRNNMLRYYQAVVCDGCGELQSHDARDPRLNPPVDPTIMLAGRLLSVAFAVAGVTVALRYVGLNWAGGMLSVAFFVFGIGLGQVFATRLGALLRQFRPNTGATAFTGLMCDKCQRGRLLPVPATPHAATTRDANHLPCPACGALEVQFRIVGIS